MGGHAARARATLGRIGAPAGLLVGTAAQIAVLVGWGRVDWTVWPNSAYVGCWTRGRRSRWTRGRRGRWTCSWRSSWNVGRRGGWTRGRRGPVVVDGGIPGGVLSDRPGPATALGADVLAHVPVQPKEGLGLYAVRAWLGHGKNVGNIHVAHV